MRVKTKSTISTPTKQRIHRQALDYWREGKITFMDAYQEVFEAYTHDLANNNFGVTMEWWNE